MNRIKLAALLTLVPALAFAQGITGTRHDMNSLSATQGPKASGAMTQTCIFCHTPHLAAAQALIWNRTAVTADRGWTGVSTSGNLALPRNISASSKRCLSCHDGTVALGDVNNSGGGGTANIAVTGGTNGQFVGSGYLVGNGTGGNEMLNNHPVSIAYAGQTAYNGTTSTQTTGIATTFTYWGVANASCETPSGLCTMDPINGPKIYLYGAVGSAGIECGSCHEVHNKYGGSYFLRAPVAGSAICLGCHQK